jgi:hypothetical protein
MNTNIIVTGIAILAVLVILVWRFSTGAYGKLTPSDQASTAWRSYGIDPDCNYFISGSDDFPNAIMGLSKSLTLDSDLWKRIEPAPAIIRDLVDNMGMRAAEGNQFLQGCDILDDKGRRVGSWFSLPGLDIMIKKTGDNRFAISTPPIETWPQR